MYVAYVRWLWVWRRLVHVNSDGRSDIVTTRYLQTTATAGATTTPTTASTKPQLSYSDGVINRKWPLVTINRMQYNMCVTMELWWWWVQIWTSVCLNTHMPECYGGSLCKKPKWMTLWPADYLFNITFSCMNTISDTHSFGYVYLMPKRKANICILVQ